MSTHGLAGDLIDQIVRANPDFDLEAYVRSRQPSQKPDPQDDQRLLSIDATIDYLGGISKPTLWRITKAGGLTPVRIGGRTLYARADLDAFIARKRAN